MKKLRQVLRLGLYAKMAIRAIHRSLKLSVGAIQKILSKAKTLGLTWEAVEKLGDVELADLFYPRSDNQLSGQFEQPDWGELHRELSRKGVTKHLLWEEYTQAYPNRSYSYSQYCFLYCEWVKKQKRSMRQVHKAGEKLFVDYAGQTMPIACVATGEVDFAQIFVAVLGASNYVFAEATRSQKLADWTGSHVRAFEFFGGVTELVIPDNLKSATTKACRYDPELNSSYQQLAEHYGTVIIPARPRKPKDKSKAEIGVQIIERWILARLRHHTFFSLSELNQYIQLLLEEVNNKPFQRLKGTRKEWFELMDKPVLSRLPKQPYEHTEIKQVKVNIDYHIQFDEHYYSVPHHLVGESVELHAKANIIEVYFYNQRVTSHPRKYHYGMSTLPEHMPKRHQKHHQWSAARLINWAQSIGDEACMWVKALIAQKAHEEQAYRVCLGLLNLSKTYSGERLNKACLIANKNRFYRLKQIKNILKSNQDQLIDDGQKQLPLLPQTHENIRGPESYH